MSNGGPARNKRHAEITARCDEWFRGVDDRRRMEATDGSAQLLERCNGLYRRFAERHRLPLEQARDFQLQGYRA